MYQFIAPADFNEAKSHEFKVNDYWFMGINWVVIWMYLNIYIHISQQGNYFFSNYKN